MISTGARERVACTASILADLSAVGLDHERWRAFGEIEDERSERPLKPEMKSDALECPSLGGALSFRFRAPAHEPIGRK
jgi:hypothetical protein